MAPPAPNRHAQPNCLILGGGVAGIAAAVRLAQAGLPVTLVETRQRLGGRATSFTDPATGQVLDNCQHVLLGCCTNLLDLYDRLGVREHIAWHRRLFFRHGRGPVDVLEGDDLPAPLHLARGLWRFGGLSWGGRLAIAGAMWKLLRLGAAGRRPWHRRSFAAWLEEQGQPAEAVLRFWTPVVVGAVNETPARVAADYAMQVFQDGFLAHEQAYVMGLSSVPLVRLYDAAESVLTAAGGRLLLSRSVERLEFSAATGRVDRVLLDGGQALSAEAVVSALPPDRLSRLCPPELRAADARLGRLEEFTFSPIVGIHLVLDRPVMALPHLVLTDSPLHWIFNKGVDAATGRQHLHAVVSAAHDLVKASPQAITALAFREVARALPGAYGRESTAHPEPPATGQGTGPGDWPAAASSASGASLVHARVVKEKRATFSAGPGVDALRPGQAPAGVGNLYLAGDWTRTGWPATMEGAARSGYLAADALLTDAGQPAQGLVPDLPPGDLVRLLAGRPR